MRDLLKLSDAALDPERVPGLKVTLSVLFSSFVNQKFVLKQLAELKEGHLRTSQNRMLFLSFSDPFSSGVGSLMLLGALKHVLGPLRSKMGPTSLIFFVICYLLFFSCS